MGDADPWPTKYRQFAKGIGTILSWQLLILITLCGHALAAAKPPDRFTVRDSIEMNRFVSPNPRLQRETAVPPEMSSRTGKWAIVVTQRGDLAANQVQATMWLLDTDLIRQCVHHISTCPPPHPILRLSGTTTTLNDEKGMITDLHWLPDSENLAFLGRNGSSRRRLYMLDVAKRSLRQLTPDDQDVSQFEMTDGSKLILYTVAARYEPPPASSAVVASGRTLFSLLFPEDLASSRPNRDELWVLRDGKPWPVIDSVTRRPVLVNCSEGGTPKEILSAAPDGHHAVVNTAVTSIPTPWQNYLPTMPTLALKHIADELLQYEFAEQVPERYVLVDLDTGSTTVMLDAPLGRTLGYIANGGQTEPVWSRDGRKVLLVDTFVPLGQEHGERTPAIVSYDLQSRTWTYVAPFKEGRDPTWVLSDVAWDEDRGEIVLRYSDGGPAPETYRQQNGEWKLFGNQDGHSKSVSSQRQPRLPLALSIRQDLNTPPKLFAGASRSDAREIWDPNPQLRTFDLGGAVRYRWRTKAGKEVKGILFRPSDFVSGRRYPLVIEPRMYSEHAFIVDGIYATAAAARALTGAGVLVLEAGEPNDPGTNMSNDDWYASQMFAAADGYEAAVAQLATDGLVDDRRVGIFGFSRTCWNVMFTLTQKPKLFAAATIVDGITYGYFQYLQAADGGQALAQEFLPYGTQPVGKGLQKWLDHSPDFNLDKVNVPLRFEAHERASVLENWGTYAMFRILNRPVDLIMLPGASHVVSMPADILESQEGDVDWFRFWLQGYEDSSQAKVEQYRRWERLCDMQVEQNPDRPAFCKRSMPHE